MTHDFDPARIVPDEARSLADGAIEPWARGDRKLVREALNGLSATFGIDLTVPYSRLPRKHRDLLMYGSGPAAKGRKRAPARPPARAAGAGRRRDAYGEGFEGLVPNLRRRYENGSWIEQENLEAYRSLRPCPGCGGDRLRPQSRAVKVKGRTTADYVGLPIAEALGVFDALELTPREGLIAEPDPAGDPGPSAVPERRRGRLSDARTERRDALGRRGPAHPAGDADRLEPHRRALRARRAVDRPAPAGQPPSARHARPAPRPRQHRRRRRARRGDDPDGRLRDRPRTGRRRARRPRDLPGVAGRSASPTGTGR